MGEDAPRYVKEAGALPLRITLLRVLLPVFDALTG
jgi:hypothetical protein